MTPTLLERALDPEVVPPADEVSERILDGALAVAAASGVRNLTMDLVAQRAGVGRMTVYRRFGERDKLVEALSVREARRCLAQLEAAVDPELELGDRVAEGFVVAMRIAREHPLLNRLARLEPDTVLTTLTADSSEMFRMLRDASSGWLALAGLEPAKRREQVADLLVRLCVSFVLIQDSSLPLGDDAAARRVARELIAPIATAP
ncbi:MAG: TetR/AcrR family transcriptional regulator [Thermoleophilaceae bacterium]|nr:TetR/AcrR family transcriptional regulator [Thermoleophilaceae bacterium]